MNDIIWLNKLRDWKLIDIFPKITSKGIDQSYFNWKVKRKIFLN